MKLFTFLLNYNGGVYIKQVWADNEFIAPFTWARELNVEDIEDFSLEDKNNIIEDGFEDHLPTVQIEGCQNIWCVCARIRNEVCWIHYIQTAVL